MTAPPSRLMIGEIVDKLLRAARNGSRLHLDAEHARALISSRAYPVLVEIQVEELEQEWRDEQ